MTVASITTSSPGWAARVLSHVGGKATLKHVGRDAGISSLFVIGGYLTKDEGPLKDATPQIKRLVNLVFGSPMLATLTLPELIKTWKEMKEPGGKAAIPDFVMHGLTTAIALLGISNNDREMITAASMLATLFAMAGHLEAGVEAKSLDGIGKLKALIPAKAKRLRYPGGQLVEEVDIAALKLGDHVLVAHNEPVPVDGKIIGIYKDSEELAHGAIHSDVSYNGEGVQHPVSVTSPVRQCARPAEGTNMVVEVKAVAAESTLMREIDFLKKAEDMPSHAAHRIKRGISNIYVPAMMAACAAQFALAYHRDHQKHAGCALDPKKPAEAIQSTERSTKTHGAKHSTKKAVKRTAELAIKMAPCAIMASTLVIPFVKNALASTHGVMIRKESSLDTMKNITHVVTDLRGTLTKGVTEFRGLHIVGQDGRLVEKNDHALLAMIGKAQSVSTHHVAEALKIASAKAGHSLKLAADESSVLHMNKGVSARLGKHRLVVGCKELLEESGYVVPEALVRGACNYEGSTTYFCHELDGVQCFGFAGLQDELREGTKHAINALVERGVTITVATGMEEASAQYLVKQLSPEGKIQLRAACDPELKTRIVASLMADKRNVVAAVGDAANDAPFMKYVEKNGGVSLAIKSTAAAVTEEAASAVVQGIHQLPDLMTLSRRLSHALWLNVSAAVSWMTLLVGSHIMGHEMKTEHASIAHETPTFLLALAGLAQSLSLVKGVSR